MHNSLQRLQLCNEKPSGATITYADGSRKTLPIDSTIQEILWCSAEIEWIECDEPGSGLLAELLQGLKDKTGTEPLEFTEKKPVVSAPPPYRLKPMRIGERTKRKGSES